MNNPENTIDPFFMYGTAWKEDETEDLTLLALQNGFRAVDTANQRKHYYEEGVGKAVTTFLETTEITRDDLFLQSKYTYQEGQDHRLPYDPDADYPAQVHQSIRSSLEHLNTTYLDSYVLHGPSTGTGLNDKDYEVWQAMEELHEEGLTRHLGVSNINPQQLELLLDAADIIPTFVQNRCFAHHHWDKSVRKICDDNDIIYQGFSLLTANRKYLNTSEMKDLANKYQMPIPSITFAFATQLGMLPLTGTTKEIHMRQDLLAIENQLDQEDLKKIENIAFT